MFVQHAAAMHQQAVPMLGMARAIDTATAVMLCVQEQLSWHRMLALHPLHKHSTVRLQASEDGAVMHCFNRLSR